MSSVMHAEQPLRERLDEAQRKVDGLQHDLRSVDAELAELAVRREPYQLLGQICDSLEKLDGLGGSELFWGSRADAGERLHQARAQIGAFEAQIRSVEDKRAAVIDEIKGGEDVLFILEDDLYEIELEKERQASEWMVERDVDGFPQHEQHLAWARAGEDDRRFRRSLATALLVAALAGVLLPLIKIPLPDLQQRIDLPERFARLIEREERKPLPPPAVVEAQPEPPKPEEPKPEEKPPEQKPIVADQPPPPAPQSDEPAPAPAPSARQRAEAAGILAFRESFATLAVGRPAAHLGASARVGNSGESRTGPPERSMITTEAPGSSGGINLASFSRDLGGGSGDGGGIEGVAVTRVASSIGASGPGGAGPGGAGVGNGTGRGVLAGRTDEEIQIVFDRYKSALYRLYNRELRNDPTLRGQMILRLTIEPDGSVSMCVLQSSDMNAPALAEQVVERVKAFSFGAKDVPAITIIYPIDFLPAA
jgi:outer membrane biosynthesis protein TonB